MKFRWWVGLGLALAALLVSPRTSRADNYPVRPVRLVVSFAAGGVGDVLGRLMAQALQQKLGQTFFVENKPGGDGTVGMREAIRSAPDGYTLLVGGLGAQIIPQLMRDDFPFDVREELVVIAITGVYPNVVAVNKDLPVSSARELVTYLKARPGQLNFGSSGRVASDRLAAELFMMETGTKMQNVPYRGGGVAINDLIAGQTHVQFPQLPAVIGSMQTGQVKALAVTTRDRLSQFPDVPTLAESVLPGFNVGSWNAIYAPRGLPQDIRDTLSNAIVAAVNDREVAARLRTLGVEPVGIVSDRATAFFNEEFARWKRVIDAAGLKLER
jgi:tripartite-type tricarboxylate transporter receptor subunit TctC